MDLRTAQLWFCILEVVVVVVVVVTVMGGEW